MAHSKNDLQRIRSLLALAEESNNGTEGERETALRRANSLMNKLGVTFIELEASERDEAFGQVGESRFSLKRTWKETVYHGVAVLYQCQVMKQSRELCIFGREGFRDKAAIIGDWLIDSIAKEAEKASTGQPNKTAFKNSFSTSAAYAIYTRCKAISATQAQPRVTGSGLVPIDEGRNYMMARYNTKTVTRKSKVRCRDGLDAGKAYGGRVSLNDQVGRANGVRQIGRH